MQLNPDDSSAKLDFEETSRRIRTLTRELSEVRDGLAKSERDREDGLRNEDREFEIIGAGLEKRFLAELKATQNREIERRQNFASIRKLRQTRIQQTADRLTEELNRVLDEERRRADAEINAIHERLGAEGDRERTPIERRLKRWDELLPPCREQFEATEGALTRLADRHGVARGEGGAWTGSIDVDADPEGTGNEVRAALEGVLTRTQRAGSSWTSGFARTGPMILYHTVLLIIGAAAAVVAVRLGAETVHVAIGLAGLAIATALLHLFSRSVRKKYGAIVQSLHEEGSKQADRFERHARAAQDHLDAVYIKGAEEHQQKLSEAERRVKNESLARTATSRRRLSELEGRRERAEARLKARNAARVRDLDAEEEDDREKMRLGQAAAGKEEGEAHEERIRGIETGTEDLVHRLNQRRDDAMAGFTRFALEARRSVDSSHRPWAEIDPARIELPREFPEIVPVGRVRISLDALLGASGDVSEPALEFTLPVTTTYPEHGSLLVQHPPGERDRALEILTNTVLRALASFPAGKIRLTIIDPVGLGQSFSALMHLADHDEDLVSGRIWTESLHIERRLSDLTEHIEKVIQKYLRNRYVTIGEYNEEAGELQEPYHLLVIADFPTALNELAAERLASIISSGPRCGVYTLIAHDVRQTVLPPIDLGLLKRNGPTLRVEPGGCRLDGELVTEGEFLPEPLPPPDATRLLLDRVGRLSVDAAHIELPFEAIAPGEESIWTGSTEKGVRVPIGRTGAERLQYLDLGRGTAQHALIAGRTGAGKSTLFHVMITNMALWFNPEEIEFYLIDFKKGVEFKPYATHRLPHARVVAIESDREFGLSVLKAVDAELSRRGDLFRAAGVQDLAAYRRDGAGEKLPRTMLFVDEFQEFFTDDDAVAHDSALLLDRFVRQGRAFGIHVVLGSQTLSGIYALARGTLGQMGVRIALQCNESDSYLILSEDNGVARLLSRPGEAIYNDKSGLLEGNNPFQVVWIAEEQQQRYLSLVATRADATPIHRSRPTVVFEGNQPAAVERNPILASRTQGSLIPQDGDDRVWLGEPNAIKGPTEARFLPASGSNLLVVGQRRDAAFAMLASAVLSLSAQHSPDGLRVVILDGGGHEPEFAAHFDELIAAVPHRVDRFDLRSSPEAVAELSELVKSREESGGDRTPVYLFTFGLQRLRALRKEDDYSMPYGEDPVESAGDQFATILTEGPPQRVHTTVWCDTVQNLQRTLSRRTLREFDMKVLFQMSAADSSELIESSAANRLGLSAALLAVESQGTFEKFRPYAIPVADVMRRLGGGKGSD